MHKQVYELADEALAGGADTQEILQSDLDWDNAEVREGERGDAS